MTLFGLLNIRKPAGVTSRRVVDQVARLAGRGTKVGHAGTLDPLATGVLVIGIGQATRLVEYVQQMPKRYEATFLLGQSSTTEDIEGEISYLLDAPIPSLAELQHAANELTGEILQMPPQYSALKVAGKRAYALARSGQEVELAARTIHVHQFEITRYVYPEFDARIECGSGTYVRSLGRDLAQRVGTAATMSALVRTAIGDFTLETALEAESLTRDALAVNLRPPLDALRGILPICQAAAGEVERVSNGLSVARDGRPGDCALVAADGTLVAILAPRTDDTLAPVKTFARP